MILKLRRDSEYLEVKVKPVRSKKNNCMLGIWVRDNAQGLGTVTFLNSDSRFGALGHGIHDTDTNALMEIRNGRVYETSAYEVSRKELTVIQEALKESLFITDIMCLEKIDKKYGLWDFLERLTAQKTCFRTRIRWR